ncbi:CusA/CzcA family heavy metal efflux RND transporter [Chryseobacterium carnipullorum]|jgi:cobalt-zinc-cadmium resistance protein CzcA|uniref:CusA/CzcA family heavy metal efflux RND transporter n=2 Tax=Bacteroidota TaxID=976 RepID=A0ACD5C325_9SPHI|nr:MULTISPECIES: CusA/CzcA family heavy metal efflux RND transporter [Weeksellaceae]ATL44102.1 CusA/CzcA family heavy metal efflux RND transporter [Elizabethkingia miricola]MXS70881.1 CusA/CzcA family heavy metal efflux RND transporter [Flavobacteriaceae bacterium W22]AQX84646.1 acriflavine resistance protein B [Elizabethkingia bruuniana]AZA49002.1 CusA/CzcA family heavy metal efflux RND transporter [Chryseobacterium carnipullorum]AZA63899.1 CusA/CzcA family heavy metal efflux RND transporter 
MLNNIIHFSIKNKLVIGLFTLALICWGSYSVTKLPIDATPDITDNQVMVITVSPTLAAQEVEQLVTFPVEQTMVSIPGIKDMRSFSRFGLSIVTIVFEEKVDIYWGRQQVQERLTLAAKNIPEGVGVPEMAPLTTGLGEIYQYVIHPKKGYEDKYDATELRTIQDWIIKRQLLGTPGVAEVSGFGGFVKQYEIAIEPDRLASQNINISDIFTALEKNNQNTGGAYIDKGPNAFFIRSEGLVKNIEEIKKIVVKNEGGIPVLLRDVADVRFGNGARYGAATRNAQGETVTGIVMMLKGANSSEVITNVKAKIEEIQKSLPEGVEIEPFLDRKKLVDGAISTVSTNLVEGALIVIFVLILFLGNLRGGLVVASVIPLAMLFAIAMMNLFGVSGNLMSLGAIDFGIIVDGTVIIVEAVLHRITTSKNRYGGVEKLTQEQMDEEVFQSSTKIRSAAAFGEIIILIVYLPLLALVGVEGKMFTPMAQTVSFAIMGAFLLSFTYVPMMSALVLSKKTTHKDNFSDKMMRAIQRVYSPIIEGAMKRKLLVISIAVAMFVITLFAFNRMGGEFIPQLDEGDFAVETRVPVGSSINQMIDVSQKAQDILLKNYPEVKQVVNKIGSGEIPTDPMPIEAGDMVVVLKPKKEWTSAADREELIDKMQQSLAVIPNATFSFQQPIQMRFNELLTGAKQDVVLKIYGEDLDVLSDLASDVGKKIKSVEGVEDLYVEEITGLPQISIQFDRDKIAQYGMNVEDVNSAIETGFAGKTAGLLYEGERRFDVVVRLDSASRADITDVQNLFVSTPTGQQIPLSEVANISYKPGPVQIQRDNAKRRITLGFNVRNRDVKSIVNDIQDIVAAKVKMPAGYHITYGGQFKNLEEANARLAVALPVALLLILLLLYFTFRSVKQGLLIFTAIPLSAIGGVFALLIRDMPFSISAGVGFIALFGVAVLNGIVLIAEFNRLAKEGVTDIYERVRIGTKVRLRPVLMTAMVASLGFLPMAISSSSGAEVQRPLATVVIGGLITATALTLLVLPVLYIYFTKSTFKMKKNKTLPTAILLLGFLCFSSTLKAQVSSGTNTRVLTLQQSIDEAVKNNNSIRIAEYNINVQKALKKGSVTIPKTELSYTQGVVSNPTINDNLINVTQRFDFPTLYSNQSKLAQEKIISTEKYKAVSENELIENVKLAYLQYQYVLEKGKLIAALDSIYSNLSKASDARYRTGESTNLEKMTSSVQLKQIQNELEKNNADVKIAKQQLQTLLNTTDDISIAETNLTAKELLLTIENFSANNNPIIGYLQQEVNVSQQEIQVEKSKMLPEIILGYSAQTYKGMQTINGIDRTYTGKDRFSFFQIGIGIPLFPGGYKSKINAAKINREIAATQVELNKTNLNGQLKELEQQYAKLQNELNYYQQQALPQANLIISNSEKSFKSGEVSYAQHLQNLTLANNIRTAYVESLYNFNKAIIAIETLSGNK